jgi:hypothetical protein
MHSITKIQQMPASSEMPKAPSRLIRLISPAGGISNANSIDPKLTLVFRLLDVASNCESPSQNCSFAPGVSFLMMNSWMTVLTTRSPVLSAKPVNTRLGPRFDSG